MILVRFIVQRKVVSMTKQESAELKAGDMVKIINVRSKPHAGHLIGKSAIVVEISHRLGTSVVFFRKLEDPSVVYNSHPINLEMVK